MLRGKESSNRIELSRLVQDSLNFGESGSLRLWGWGGWVDGGGGWLGVPHTYVHMRVHAYTYTHVHAHVVNMIFSCKWPPPLGEYLGIPYDVICACVCMRKCACAHRWGALSHHPPPHPPTQPPPQRGDPRNQSKFNSTWTNRDISILFEDLKSVETPPFPWVGV